MRQLNSNCWDWEPSFSLWIGEKNGDQLDNKALHNCLVNTINPDNKIFEDIGSNNLCKQV